MPQKALALTVGVDSSRLSGIETGRRFGPADDLVDRICKALELNQWERAALLGAAAHDRAMREIARNLPPEALPLLALSLDAARLLSPSDRDKLASFTRELIGPRERLAALPPDQEVSMA